MITVFQAGRNHGGYNDEGWELLWKDSQFFYRSWAGAAVSGERRGNELVPFDSGVQPISYDEALDLTSNIPFAQCKQFFEVKDWLKILENNDIHARGIDELHKEFVQNCLNLHGAEKVFAARDGRA